MSKRDLSVRVVAALVSVLGYFFVPGFAIMLYLGAGGAKAGFFLSVGAAAVYYVLARLFSQGTQALHQHLTRTVDKKVTEGLADSDEAREFLEQWRGWVDSMLQESEKKS